MEPLCRSATRCHAPWNLIGHGCRGRGRTIVKMEARATSGQSLSSRAGCSTRHSQSYICKLVERDLMLNTHESYLKYTLIENRKI
uniref:Uncharacterized protein n=1 Tax=Romanomermis culicivorax TaxID=13658 RepID=A0A915L5M1_ROMCU